MSRVIDLEGPQGNAFALMAIAEDWLRQMDRRDEFRLMRTEMMSGDYSNLLRVFQSKFGDLVEFINHPDEESDI
tara:strand:- start:806 stop:1027 length:222 start_codon:yes stop_codon:yes gene_type:complete